MPKTRPPFPPAFRSEAVKLMRDSDKPLSQLARDLGVSQQTLRTWRRQAQLDVGERDDGLTSDQREELRRLRAENRTLQMEREVLRKAAAFFARESERR
ncbi:MAG: transposase [Trebonia sp.]